MGNVQRGVSIFKTLFTSEWGLSTECSRLTERDDDDSDALGLPDILYT